MPDSLRRRTLLGAGIAAGAASATGTLFATSAFADGEAAVDLPLIGPAEDDEIHVMTFNVFASTLDSPYTWDERRPRIAHLLEQEHPTVLGLQEAQFHQAQDIMEDLDGYNWVHLLSRDDQAVGESTPICYDASRLKPVAYDHLWLSDNPRLIGSADWGNTQPRMLTWVRFSDLETGTEFIVLNTHFDNSSADARHRSAEMVVDVVADFDVATLVLGDFNNSVTTRTYEILVDESDLDDTWVVADEQLTPEYGTVNGWDPEPVEGDPRIDWVLSTPDVTTLRTAINAWTDDEHPPSDHWAVQSLVTL